MRTKTIAAELASLCGSIKRCKVNSIGHWEDKHTENVREIEKSLLPSGSGIDCGTKVDIEASNDEKLVLIVEFHCMDDNGMYCGWRTYKITATPSFLSGVDVRVTGRDFNGIKDYLAETYGYCLQQQLVPNTLEIVS